MTTDAKTVQCATAAGLVLAGQDEDGAPEWMGDRRAFQRFGELVMQVEETGTYPWIFPF